MSLRDFRKAGNPSTLLASFLYFDVSFMIWVILGALGPFIAEAYRLSATQRGLLTAVPLLGGSCFRPVLGFMTERYGGRRTGSIGLGVTAIPLLLAWRVAGSFAAFLGVGLLLGVAGASFAAALPLASGWYPPEHQGLAMGIAGAGNSGTLMATLFAPRLARAFGWQSVFATAIVPLALVWILFFALARDAPAKRKVNGWADYASILRVADAGWFCLLYSLTFGGFVGLASYLSIFFHDQYRLTAVQSGDFTTLVVLSGSLLRPVGGVLADRFGGYPLLVGMLAGAGICLGVVATLPAATVALAFLAVAMGLLGMGNGSVFQLVPQRFPQAVGIMTGIVGAAGGFGGFLLPSALGLLKDRSGSFGVGFASVTVMMFAGFLCLLVLRESWRRSWPPEAAARAGLTKRSDDMPEAYVSTARI